MSQGINYQRVATVQEANNFQRGMAPIIAQIMNSAPAEVMAGVKKCCKQKHTKSTLLLAPSEMKVIQADYLHHLTVTQQQKCGKVEQMKVAAIATLVKSQDNLLVAEPEKITGKVQRIVAAETVKEVTQEIKSAFKEVKAQHTKSFVANIANAVKEAAAAIGFKEVSVQEPCSGMVRIVATNSTGQNLLAEIETQKQVDIRTELVGYTDGSCEQVMRAFDEEMSIRGITTKHKEQKATHGIPRLPYAKRLLKPRVSRRSFEDEATVQEEKPTNTITIKQ